MNRTWQLVGLVAGTAIVTAVIVHIFGGVVGGTWQTNFLKCDQNSGACRTPIQSGGAEPACVTANMCNTTDNYCYFQITPHSTCLPPDVSYCDPSDGGIHPECLNAIPPADASACGTRQCVADAGVCGWSTQCQVAAAH
jgi:hypothetical protein